MQNYNELLPSKKADKYMDNPRKNPDLEDDSLRYSTSKTVNQLRKKLLLECSNYIYNSDVKVDPEKLKKTRQELCWNYLEINCQDIPLNEVEERFLACVLDWAIKDKVLAKKLKEIDKFIFSLSFNSKDMKQERENIKRWLSRKLSYPDLSEIT